MESLKVSVINSKQFIDNSFQNSEDIDKSLSINFNNRSNTIIKNKEISKKFSNFKDSFSERQAIKDNNNNEKSIEMEKINKSIDEKVSIHSKNDKDNKNNEILIEDLKKENQELKNQVYFQKQENKKLLEIIKKLMNEQFHLSFEPKIPQDFIPELKTSKFSKYFIDDEDEKYDSDETKHDPTFKIKNIEKMTSFRYKMWSFERFINTKLHIMNLKFFKNIDDNSKINSIFKQINQEIVNKSDYIMNIQNIVINNTDGIFLILINYNI